MSTLRVSLFGKFSISLGDYALEDLHSTKAQELFSFLLLHRGRPHPRETLAGMLWGDCPTMQSRKYLRQALWQIQLALNSSLVPAARRVLLADPDWVRLNEQADLWLDVGVFERACALVRAEPLDASMVRALEAAVELYQGDLLEGWYQDWCLHERERFQRMFLAMLDKLMGLCEARHAFKDGMDYGARILSYDSAHELTHQRLMRLQYLAGDRAGALRQYERCAAALKEELGAKPSEQTKALYRQIRADRLEAPPVAPATAPPTVIAASPLPPWLLSHLKQLRSRLVELQSEVQRDVTAVEQALKLEAQQRRSRKRSSTVHRPTLGLASGSVK